MMFQCCTGLSPPAAAVDIFMQFGGPMRNPLNSDHHSAAKAITVPL
jgi:hypothetical protein